MKYAEVCVNSTIPGSRTFSYAIPPALDITVGQAVFVPFGTRLLQGIVMELTDSPAVEDVKDVAGVIEPQLVLSPAHITLANWLSRRYLSPLFDAVALMLPPGFERKPLTFFAVSIPDEFDLTFLSDEQRQAFDLVRRSGRINQKELAKELGQKKSQRLSSQLVKLGLLSRSYELEPIKARPRIETFISLAIDAGQVEKQLTNLKRAPKQAALLSFLAEQSAPVSLSITYRETGSSRAAVDALAGKGLLSISEIEVRRDPLAARPVNLSFPLNLIPDQAAAFAAVCRSLRQPKKENPDVFLLHGVTGSGKTEIYLQSLAEAIKLGKKGIVLVPEISLTPQTIERFSSRFPGRVAVLHSQLSLGEQFDEWQRIKRGEVDVVIGPRSALFAPQPDLGLIILDEEHEWTYKQTENSPRYHARDTAIELARLTGAVVVLGSATPDVESFYHAQRGDYHLLPLPERLTPQRNTPLPAVEVVDMREELKSGNRSMFSRSLTDAVIKAVSGGEQVMLFLNRRGGATFIQCRDCGFVLTCRRCDVPLSYHIADDILLSYHQADDILACHQCNYRMPVPQRCPRCQSPRIKFLGAGTQKLEQEVAGAFPKARRLRWDSDTATGRESHQEILDKFRSHLADILIGTQMITKGLDLPGVTLVGVMNADTALYLPDFRAGERTFQLLAQVAGRAGRGWLGGRVIVQTYSPENYAVQAASRHDYTGFYAKEIEYRRQLNNPPYTRLARLTFAHKNDGACQREAERVKQVLISEIETRGVGDITIIGPAPAFIRRLRGRYRWQIILRGDEPAVFLAQIDIPQGWTTDVDPVGL